jgi:hypothetical protein
MFEITNACLGEVPDFSANPQVFGNICVIIGQQQAFSAFSLES